MILTCPCGKQSADVPSNGSIGDQAKASGMFPYMNVKNGLTTTWLCVECEKHAKEAILMLVEVFGSELQYIHLANKVPKL